MEAILFGFKKKKFDLTLVGDVANDTLQILNSVLEEELNSFQATIEDRFDVKHPNTAASLYFADAIQYDLITMAYQFGFIQGMSQSYDIIENVPDVMFVYGKTEENTIKNYYSILGMKNNPKSYLELWEDVMECKYFETNEEAASAMLTGMAEGKSFGDISQSVTKDYSILKDSNSGAALNVDGYRKLFRQWSFNVLYDEDKQALLRQC